MERVGEPWLLLVSRPSAFDPRSPAFPLGGRATHLPIACVSEATRSRRVPCARSSDRREAGTNATLTHSLTHSHAHFFLLTFASTALPPFARKSHSAHLAIMASYPAAIPSPLPANDYADYLIHHTNNLALPAPDTVPSLLSLLALFPSPSTPSPTYLALRSPLPEKIVSELRRCRGYLKAEWEEIASGRIKALLYLGRAAACRDAQDLNGEREELHRAYDSYEAVVGTFLRQLTSLPQTTSARPYLALLIKLLLDLRALALLADKVLHTASTSAATSVLAPGSSQPQPHLEATARQLNKAFTACVADRNADIELSRKWATYRIVAILFRTYFKVRESRRARTADCFASLS